MLNSPYTNNFNLFRIDKFSLNKKETNSNKKLKNKNSPNKKPLTLSIKTKYIYHNIKTRPKIKTQLAQPAQNKKFYTHIIIRNLSKYNSTQQKYYSSIIKNIIYNDQTHYVSQFKDFLYWEDDGEFLKRFYLKSEFSFKFKKLIQFFNTEYKIYQLYPHYFHLGDCKNVMFNYYNKMAEILQSQCSIKGKHNQIDLNNEVNVFYEKILSTSAITNSKNSKNNEMSIEDECFTLFARTRQNSKNGRNIKQLNLYENNLMSTKGNNQTIQSLLKYFSDEGKTIKKKESNNKQKINKAKKSNKLTYIKTIDNLYDRSGKSQKKYSYWHMLLTKNCLNDLLLLRERNKLFSYKNIMPNLNKTKENKTIIKNQNKTQSNSNSKIQDKDDVIKSYRSLQKEKISNKNNTLSLTERKWIYNIKKIFELKDKKRKGLYSYLPLTLQNSSRGKTQKSSDMKINNIKLFTSALLKRKLKFCNLKIKRNNLSNITKYNHKP